jgi:hypothetical protein
MPYGVLTNISLEPYTANDMLFCSGYSAQELHDWIQDVYVGEWYGTDRIPTLGKIKRHAQAKTDLLKMVLDQREGIDNLNDEKHEAGGCLFYDSDKRIYIMVMRAGFNPYDPENMVSLAHEIIHLCQTFLPKYFDRNNEMENEAYFHSHIMRQIYMSFVPNYTPPNI